MTRNAVICFSSDLPGSLCLRLMGSSSRGLQLTTPEQSVYDIHGGEPVSDDDDDGDYGDYDDDGDDDNTIKEIRIEWVSGWRIAWMNECVRV